VLPIFSFREVAVGEGRAKYLLGGHSLDVDADQVATLRALLAGSPWLEQARAFGRALRRSPRSAGGLLVVGTPTYEPWHVTAHLDDEARLAGIPELAPTLVRWAPPAGAPPHLSVGLARLEAARRGETVFVLAEESAPVPLLERVDDARRVGATILALDEGDPELDALAHEALAVPESLSFDAGQHLVSAAAGERDAARTVGARGLRARLARLLDTVSGPNT
jgi:hypothetical protein